MINPKFEVAPNLDLAETNPNLSPGEAYIGTVSKGQSAAQPTVSSSEAMWGALAIAATAAGQGFALANAYKVNAQNRNFAQQDIKIKELMLDKNKSPEQKRKEHTEILNSTPFYAAGNYIDWKTKSYSNNMDTWLGDHDLNKYTENLVDLAKKKWASENPGGELTPIVIKEILDSVQASNPETKGSTWFQKNKLAEEQKHISNQKRLAEHQTLIALAQSQNSQSIKMVFNNIPEEEKKNLSSTDPVYYQQLLRLNNDPNQTQEEYTAKSIEETINALSPEQQKGLNEATPEFQASFQNIIRETADKRYKAFQKEYSVSQAISQAEHGELLLNLSPSEQRTGFLLEHVNNNTENKQYLLMFIPRYVAKGIANAKEGADPLAVEIDARAQLVALLDSKKSNSGTNYVELESEQSSVWGSLKSELSLRNVTKEQYIDAVMNTQFNKEKAIISQAELIKGNQVKAKDSLQTIISSGQLIDSYYSDNSLRARLEVDSGITVQEGMRGEGKEEVLRLWSEGVVNASVTVHFDDTEYLSSTRQQNLLKAYESNPELMGNVIYGAIVKHFEDEDSLAKSIYSIHAQLDSKAITDADASQLVNRLYKGMFSSPEDLATSFESLSIGKNGEKLTGEQSKAKLYEIANKATDYVGFLKELGITSPENPSKIRNLDNTYIRFKKALKKAFSLLNSKEKNKHNLSSTGSEGTPVVLDTGETVFQVPEDSFDLINLSNTDVPSTTQTDPFKEKRGPNSYQTYTRLLENPADPEAKMAEVAYTTVRGVVSGGRDVSSTYAGQAAVYARNGGIWFNPNDSHSTIKEPDNLITQEGNLSPEGVKRYSFTYAQVVLALKADGNDNLLDSLFKYLKEEYSLLATGGGFFQAVKDKPINLIDFEASLAALANEENIKNVKLTDEQREDLAKYSILSKASNINDMSNPAGPTNPLNISKNAAINDKIVLDAVKSILSDSTSTIIVPEKRIGKTVTAALIHGKGMDPNQTLADTRILAVIGINTEGSLENAIKTMSELKEADLKKLNDFIALVGPNVPDGFPTIGDNSLLRLKLLDGRTKAWGLMTLQEQVSLTLKAVLDSPIPNSNAGNIDRSERFSHMLKVLQKDDKIAAASVFALVTNEENRETEYIVTYRGHEVNAESNPDSEGDLPYHSNTSSYWVLGLGGPDKQHAVPKGIAFIMDSIFGGWGDGDMNNQGREVQETHALEQRRKVDNPLSVAIEANNGGKPVAGLPTSGPHTAENGNFESVNPYRNEPKYLIEYGLERVGTGDEATPTSYTNAFIDEVAERGPPTDEKRLKEIEDAEKATGSFLRPPSSANAKSLDVVFFSPSTPESKVAIDNMVANLMNDQMHMLGISEEVQSEMNNILHGIFSKPLPNVEGIIANVNSIKLTSAIDANGNPQREQINTNAFHLAVRVQQIVDQLGPNVPKEFIATFKQIPRAIALRLYEIDTKGIVRINIKADSSGIPFNVSFKPEDMVELVKANTEAKTAANKPEGNRTVLDVGSYSAETVQKMRQFIMNGWAAKDIQDKYPPRPVMSNP